MSAPATNISVQSVLQGPLRIVKGQFRTANNTINTIDLSQTGPLANVDSGVRTNPNSVILCSFTTAALAIPASTGLVSIVNNSGSASQFAIQFTTAPAAGVNMDFIIFG